MHLPPSDVSIQGRKGSLAKSYGRSFFQGSKRPLFLDE